MEAKPPPTATRRPLIVIGALLVVAVAGTIVAANVVRPATFEPGSPQAVVQGFVRAVLDDDGPAALTLVDPSRRCTVVDMVGSHSGGTTARIDRTAENGDVASVIVELSESDGDPFGGDWSHRETFGLRKSGDAWLIDSTTWLWAGCLN